MNTEITTFWKIDGEERETILRTHNNDKKADDKNISVSRKEINEILSELTIMNEKVNNLIKKVSYIEKTIPITENTTQQRQESMNVEENGLENNMKKIIFGKYWWYVISTDGPLSLLLCAQCIKKMPFIQKISGYHPCDWEHSDIREALNVDFLDSFSAKDRNKIFITDNYNERNKKITDKVFLLSVEQAKNIPKNIMSVDSHWWWLRDKGSIHGQICTVTYDGIVSVSGFNADNKYGGVRPAMFVLLDTHTSHINTT